VIWRNINPWDVLIVFLLLVTIFILIRSLPMKATFTLTFNIAPAPQPIAIQNFTFSGEVGTPFTGSLGTITGGSGAPFTVSGDLSSIGLVIDAQGNITGTPTQSGTFNPTITVADSQG
jgi:hypothetical protein